MSTDEAADADGTGSINTLGFIMFFVVVGVCTVLLGAAHCARMRARQALVRDPEAAASTAAPSVAESEWDECVEDALYEGLEGGPPNTIWEVRGTLQVGL